MRAQLQPSQMCIVMPFAALQRHRLSLTLSFTIDHITQKLNIFLMVVQSNDFIQRRRLTALFLQEHNITITQQQTIFFVFFGWCVIQSQQDTNTRKTILISSSISSS